MLKSSITFVLILLLTTSIFSQIDAKGGGFRGGLGGFGGFGGFGGGKSFSSDSIPLGTGQGKMFTSSPSGKISPQEPQGSKQTESSSTIKSDLERNRQSQPSQQQQQPNGQFQQPQPRSNFFGGGYGGFGGGGLGGFGNMLMSSIMGNFIGQALFGWMFPHPAQVVSSPSPHTSQQTIAHNNSSSNNSTINKK